MMKCDYHPEFKQPCIFEQYQGTLKCIFHLPPQNKHGNIFKMFLASYISAVNELKNWDTCNEWIKTSAARTHIEIFKTLLKTLPQDDICYRFDGFVFPERVDFKDTKFMGEVHFDGASFVKGGDFSGAVFSGGANFMNAKFNGVDFVRANFSKGALFNGCGFSDVTNFIDVTFKMHADFSNSGFSGKAIFVKIDFPEVVNFIGCRSITTLIFSDIHFQKDVKFVGSVFESGSISLINVIFTEFADFQRVVFLAPVKFYEVKFGRFADFTESTIKEVLFVKASFTGVVAFTRAEIQKCTFRSSSFSSASSLLFWDCNFTRDGENLAFEDMEMVKASFLHTEIFRDSPCVRYFNVDWKTKTKEFLFDAFFALQSPDLWCNNISSNPNTRLAFGGLAGIASLYELDLPGQTEINYKDKVKELHKRVILDVERIANEIRRYYEKYGSYPDAGDFYIGEMEFKRKRMGGIFLPFVLSLYRMFSRYGERPLRALLWLFGLIVYSALIYSFSNLKVNGYDIGYSIWFMSANLWEGLKDFLPCLLYALYALIPTFKLDNFEPSYLTSAWRWVEWISGASLITLFLLALRRRFRR